MKSALSLTLIVCLLESALPATAQAQTERTGPLAKAVTREPVRLTAAGETTSSNYLTPWCIGSCPECGAMKWTSRS